MKGSKNGDGKKAFFFLFLYFFFSVCGIASYIYIYIILSLDKIKRDQATGSGVLGSVINKLGHNNDNG